MYNPFRRFAERHSAAVIAAVERLTHRFAGIEQQLVRIAGAVQRGIELVVMAHTRRVDDRDWVTIIVRDPVTGFIMGDTVHVSPGVTREVVLSPQATFGESSVFEIETESPGIAIVDIKVAGRTPMMGTLPNDARKDCSVRSGNLDGCKVGVQISFGIHNFRSATCDADFEAARKTQ